MKKIRAAELEKNLKEFDKILYYQSLPYIFKIIETKLISKYHSNLPIGYFSIKKMEKLVTRKYYWKTLYYNIKVYVRSYNIYLASKTVKHKPYANLQ